MHCKQFVSLSVASLMLAAVLTGCGGASSTASSAASEAGSEAASKITKVALTCDTGTIDDESFNQACWSAVSSYMGDDCQYYIPEADASDEDRETMIRQAVNDGAEVIVCVGYLYGASLAWAAEQYPDVKLIAIDVTQGDIGTDEIPSNCYCITFKEEQAGYLAGYAVVKDGYTKLGFLGGMAVPAVIRYGYGYVQGAEAAAAEKNVKVEMNYTWKYGESFQPSAELQTLASGWYKNGTEVIFSCGGSIFDSITAAAAANDAYVIGVDVDQSFSSDTVITPALKGIGEAAYLALTAAYDGTWAENYGNQCVTMGAAQGAVGLPVDTWSLENWSVEEYEDMFQKIVSGEIAIDNDFSNLASTEHVALNIVE